MTGNTSCGKRRSFEPDLNQRPMDARDSLHLQSTALPTELSKGTRPWAQWTPCADSLRRIPRASAARPRAVHRAAAAASVTRLALGDGALPSTWLCVIRLRTLTARLAQSVEHWTFNPRVKGSSPLLGVDNLLWPQFCPISERRTYLLTLRTRWSPVILCARCGAVRCGEAGTSTGAFS